MPDESLNKYHENLISKPENEARAVFQNDVLADFKSDPQNFLNKHPLTISANDMPAGQNWKKTDNAPTFFSFTAVPDRENFGVTVNFQNMDQNLRAYWCPYQENIATVLSVGSQADFMFTSTMSGCTFVIARTDNGVTVSHSNRADHAKKFVDKAREIFFDAAEKADLDTEEGPGFEKSEINKRWIEATGKIIQGNSQLERAKTKLAFTRSAYRQALPVTYSHIHSSSFGTATVIGVRNRETGQWAFYKQEYKTGINDIITEQF
jgi:hypothetical protein